MMKYVTFDCQPLRIKAVAAMIGPATLVNHMHEGWQQVQRLMRVSFPEWQGAAGWEITIPCVLDGLRLHTSVEGNCYNLVRMATPTKMYNPMHPPPLSFESSGDIPRDHHRAPNSKWIIAGQGLQWGDYITMQKAQPGTPIYYRVRQFVTVSLWEVFTEQLIVTSARNLHYTTKQGDSLKTIAMYFYSDVSKAAAIAKANGIRDQSKPLKPGTVLILP
jgi:hypothetical protein